MSTIYWITRLDTLCGLSLSLLILSGILGLVAIIPYCMAAIEKEEKVCKIIKKIMIVCATIFFTSAIVNVFLPTTKEALAIYGIGGTIDYIKSNDKAKELPDKVIDALDRYVDTIVNDSIK